MSYRYTVGESTEQEIKRIIEERFNRSLKEFKEADGEPDHANHQMRKNMKKVYKRGRKASKKCRKKPTA